MHGDAGIGLALFGAASVFMAYEGFQLLTYDYEDIRSPERTLPLAVMSLFSAVAARRLGLSLRGIFAELRYFLLLLVLVFVARAFTTPGTSLSDLPWLPVSREGIQAGAVTVWRLFLVVFLGLLFVATTRAAAIKAAKNGTQMTRSPARL